MDPIKVNTVDLQTSAQELNGVANDIAATLTPLSINNIGNAYEGQLRHAVGGIISDVHPKAMQLQNRSRELSEELALRAKRFEAANEAGNSAMNNVSHLFNDFIDSSPILKLFGSIGKSDLAKASFIWGLGGFGFGALAGLVTLLIKARITLAHRQKAQAPAPGPIPVPKPVPTPTPPLKPSIEGKNNTPEATIPNSSPTKTTTSKLDEIIKRIKEEQGRLPEMPRNGETREEWLKRRDKALTTEDFEVEQCVHWAKARRTKLGGNSLPGISSYYKDQEARHYVDIFPNESVKFGSENTDNLLSTVKPGSALVWTSGSKPPNHVAIIEMADENGVYISESNFGGWKPQEFVERIDSNGKTIKESVKSKEIYKWGANSQVRYISKKELLNLYVIPPDAKPIKPPVKPI